MRDRFVRKQIVFQLLVEAWIVATNPLQNHRGVFFFFIAIVSKNRFELIVFTGIDPLVVPINSLKLLPKLLPPADDSA